MFWLNDQPTDGPHTQFDRLVESLRDRFPSIAGYLARAREDITVLPKEIWRQIWSNNLIEPRNRKIRSADVVGSLLRVFLCWRDLVEKRDERIEQRRYPRPELLK